MRVAMHQPHYLPWLGLIDKIDRCDLFVVFDHVQFERKGWQNRNYVASANGPTLLTVPVVQHSRDELILDKEVDNAKPWRAKHRKTIQQLYAAGAPYWERFGPQLLEIYDVEWKKLTELALATTQVVLRGFGVTTPIVRASDVGTFSGQRNDLVAEVAAAVGTTTLLCGDGSRSYIEPATFRDHGIEIEWQNFEHPVYAQHSRRNREFLPRMAALDLLLNAGPKGIDILRSAQREHTDQ